MKYTVIIIILISMAHLASGQRWQQIANSEDNFYEAVRKIELHYATHPTGKGSGYKQYMRWKHEMEYHIDIDGTIPNSSALNYQAYQKVMKNSGQDRVSHGSWKDLGPFDYWVGDVYSGGGVGRTNCTAFHSQDPEIIWVGTPAGGLWKTTDGGATWSPMTDGFASIGISDIVVHPADPDIIYVLTGDGDGKDSPSIGVMKTTNGGVTWSPTGMIWTHNQYVVGYKLLMDPDNPETLIAAMTNGIWRTDNGGMSWVQIINNWTTDIEFAPTNSDTIYAATINQIDSAWWQCRFFRSIDNGLSWLEETDPTFPDTSFRGAVAISPSEPTNVYMLFSGGTGVNGTFRGLYKSSNHGSDFTMQSTTPNILDGTLSGDTGGDQAGYDLSIIVDPEDDSRVFVGGVNLWRSNDDGVSWNRITWWTRNYAPGTPYVHADWHNLYFRGTTLFANVDGGIYKTNNYGSSWTELTAGMSTQQFYQIDIHNNEYMGGTQDNGTNNSDFSDPQADNINGGDGFGCTWHSGDGSIKYISSQNSIARRQFGSNIYIWEEADGFWYTDIKMHSTNPTYFFLNKGNELFRGNQADFIWDFHWDSLKTNTLLEEIRGYIQGSGDFDNLMYVAGPKRLIKTTDISVIPPQWDTITQPALGIARLSDVMISPSDTSKVWITCSQYNAGNKVFASDDSGMSWTNISGSLPNIPVRCITYASGSQDGLYIGTDIGVFYRDASMSDWIYFSTYLPNVPVNDIVVEDGYVYAGTFGRGIWRTSVYSCPFNLTLTPADDPADPLNIGRQEFSAQNILTSTRIIQGSNADVFYSSGNYIDLPEGFWAKAGSQMKSSIDGCPD